MGDVWEAIEDLRRQVAGIQARDLPTAQSQWGYGELDDLASASPVQVVVAGAGSTKKVVEMELPSPLPSGKCHAAGTEGIWFATPTRKMFFAFSCPTTCPG